MKKDMVKTITVPEGIDIKINKREITINKGGDEMIFDSRIEDLKVVKENNRILIERKNANKNDKKRINSLVSHIEGYLKGLEKDYEYKLQICSIHFPMTAKIEKGNLIIKNFFGERKDRILILNPKVNVRIDNDIIIVTSPSKPSAGQQAAMIERLTKVTKKDRRVFQDGIWIIKKEKGRHKK
ncbi:MAG: 50S ribosomal protein L6 [Candidatus Pacearchaeota archaeon]|nr:50S ribosomal protein L6 [Candidatus Pacearchaeota archaeon]